MGGNVAGGKEGLLQARHGSREEATVDSATYQPPGVVGVAVRVGRLTRRTCIEKREPPLPLSDGQLGVGGRPWLFQVSSETTLPPCLPSPRGGCAPKPALAGWPFNGAACRVDGGQRPAINVVVPSIETFCLQQQKWFTSEEGTR